MSIFFRHFRPKVFDSSRFELIPDKCGGISYLLSPTGEGTYDFWLSITPLNVEFSAKQAVHFLRLAKENAMPWGSIKMTGSPILDLLVAATAQTELPTEVGRICEYIYKRNHQMSVKMKMLASKSSLNLYKDDHEE